MTFYRNINQNDETNKFITSPNSSSLYKVLNKYSNNNQKENEKSTIKNTSLEETSKIPVCKMADAPTKNSSFLLNSQNSGTKLKLSDDSVRKLVMRTQSSPFVSPKADEKPPVPLKTFASVDLKWKAKYEDCERRRKELLTQSQRTVKEKEGLQKQMKKLEEDNEGLKQDLQETTNALNALRSVSEKVIEDYDKLNNKYDVETKTLNQALEIASKWYKQNKRLKRESVVLTQKCMNLSVPMTEINIDEADGEGDDEDLAGLRKTVTDLSYQLAEKQSELNRARLQEFEAQEQSIVLTQELEEERLAKEKALEELQQLRILRDQFESVSSIVKTEVDTLRSERDKATQNAQRLKAEASQAVKERNVLAHQSTLLMGDIASNEKLLKAINEIEELKRQLEEQEQRHMVEMEELLAKLEERENESQLELLEEKLKLAESELQLALQKSEQLQSKVDSIELRTSPVSDDSGTPPPPPPPLPPPPQFSNSPVLTKKLATRSETDKLNRVSSDSLTDMANMLGLQKKPRPAVQPTGAIDELINEIKGGRFVLKATERQQQTKPEAPPPALQEMLNIIGTLKRRPRNSRPPPADVQL